MPWTNEAAHTCAHCGARHCPACGRQRGASYGLWRAYPGGALCAPVCDDCVRWHRCGPGDRTGLEAGFVGPRVPRYTRDEVDAILRHCLAKCALVKTPRVVVRSDRVRPRTRQEALIQRARDRRAATSTNQFWDAFLGGRKVNVREGSTDT